MRRDDISNSAPLTTRNDTAAQRSRYHEPCSISPALCRRPSRSWIPCKRWISLRPTVTLRKPSSSAINFDCRNPKHLSKRLLQSWLYLRRSPTPRMQLRGRRTGTEKGDITMPGNCIWAKPISAFQRNPQAFSLLQAPAYPQAIQDKHTELGLEGMDSHFLCVLSEGWSGCIVRATRSAMRLCHSYIKAN